MDKAMEQAVDAVEGVLYQKALSGDLVSMIFYLKTHRPMYRYKLNINVSQLHGQLARKSVESN